MRDLNDLFYFAQVVENGGFAPAGRSLGLPKSKLSRRIALLEERLGVRLIHRTTRQFSVTDIGQTYYEHCKAMLVEAEAAQESVEAVRAEPRGVIRMACPITLLHVHIGRMLSDFLAEYPLVTLQLEGTNRTVDLVGEAMDLAIRVRPPPLQDSDLVLTVLADRGQCLVAAPALVGRLGTPNSPAELNAWPSLGLGQLHNPQVWSLTGPDGAHVSLAHHPRYVTSDMVALRQAAMNGIGVVQLPMLMVQEQLRSGALVRVLPQWSPKREIIHAVYPHRRGLLPAVRALLDFLSREFRSIEEE
jgi:DNA-binding transcriptional LysR family regulator